MLVNEADQGPMASVDFAADIHAPVPWARAVVRGDRQAPARQNLWKVMRKRGDRVRDGAYDGVTLARTVHFDFPYVILADRGRAEEAKRFGFVFHAAGSLAVHADCDPDAEPPALPPLPTKNEESSRET